MWRTFPKEIVTGSPGCSATISSYPHPTTDNSFPFTVSIRLPSGSTVRLRKPSEDDVMVLVAPESEVQVSQLPKMVFWKSIAAVVAIVRNAHSFPLSSFHRFGQLVALSS